MHFRRPGWPNELVCCAIFTMLAAAVTFACAGCTHTGGRDRGGFGSWFGPKEPQPPRTVDEFLAQDRVDPY